MSNRELLPFVSKFGEARIMVIGDLMVDEYIWGSVSRISPEAPVPVVSVTSESLRLGGAGNVVNNIHTLGGKVLLGGVVGNDEMGRKVVQDLHKMGVDPRGVVVEADWITTVKTRIIASHQQVVRYDREIVRTIRPEALKKILALPPIIMRPARPWDGGFRVKRTWSRSAVNCSNSWRPNRC